MIWPDWTGETVAIIGSGPSRTMEQLNLCRGKTRAIVLCHEFRFAPWADWLHAGDASWWRENGDALGFAGIKSSYSANVPDVHRLENLIDRGRDSGVQALQIAAMCWASRILLIGIDLKFSDDGREHGHNKYVRHPVRHKADYPAMIEAWEQIGRKIETPVFNCSSDSALACFPHADLEAVIA